MVLPTTPEELLKILDSLEISYESHSHKPVFTVAESEDVEAEIPGVHCRNLFLKDKKDRMFLVVAANTTRIDLKKLEKIIDSGRLSFGSADRLMKYLGIYPGAVCPFTAINDKDRAVKIILDAAMMAAALVGYHPLDNARTITLRPADLMKFFDHTGHEAAILDLTPAAPDPK